MARWAQDNEIADLVVGALAVDMTHLQNVGDPEAAVRADWRVVLECKLSIIDTLHTTGLTTANAKVSDGWPSDDSRIVKRRGGPAIRSTVLLATQLTDTP